MIYNIQYSIPKNDRVAISEWQEYNITLEASNIKEAKIKANKKLQNRGVWYILDIYPIN